MNNILRFFLALVLTLAWLSARAASADAAGIGALNMSAVTWDEIACGALLAGTGGQGDRYIPLPGLNTALDISITGIAAHVELSQTFRNPSTRWLEAMYVFPLPADSAVTHLRMDLGDRVIEGVVEKKNQARHDYVVARRKGRKAALVAQQRPNLFTSSVANIPPGESITVHLSYLETVSRVGDAYSLRVPLVAAPRYVPAGARRGAGSSGSGPPILKNPHTVPPSFGKVDPVTIHFSLDAGFELDTVTSSYHDIRISRTGKSKADGRLVGRHFADRDFELHWKPAAGAAPRLAAFVDKGADGDYVLLMLQPPLPDVPLPSPPRDLILVIDSSGSMYGDSMEQAVAAARFALSTLKPKDRFNLIRFADSPSMLFPSPQPADPAALAQAENFLSHIEANGGTNMAAALRLAFSNPAAPGMLRQLVFLTDGAVGDEEELFSLIAKGTRASRLFTVGIGSAPNGYFMRRAARVGRGTYTFIGRRAEVQSKMARLLERISKPALTGIRVDWHGAKAALGGRIPDLYYGQPLTLTARVNRFRGLTVSGRYAGRIWQRVVDADAAPQAPWVSTLWARNRIKQLEDDLLGGGDRREVKARITRIGLEHQLVTPYTSLVAVEHRTSRPASQPLLHTETPVNLPAGWSYQHVFGSLPQTGLGWRAQVVEGLALILPSLLLLWCVRIKRSSPASF